MIQGAIFDADGTLLDSMPIWKEVDARYLAGYGIVPSSAVSEAVSTMTLEESSLYFKEHYHLPDTPAQIRRDILRIVDDFYCREVEPKAGIPEFLEQLRQRHIPMAIATTGDRTLLETALRRLGLDAYFQEILTCSELATGKHQPFIYTTAAERLGTPIAATVVFEDALYAIRTAAEAGFPTVGIADAAGHTDQEEIRQIAHHYMDDFSDLSAFWAFASTL